jgi:PAS domain S-box-containing protein
MPENPGGESPVRAKSELQKQIEERFGVLPNFFRLSPETPEITEKLWAFAQIAYLDNPLPSLFKERLFVYLSRFCAVRYCIARHVGFLVGLGRPSGDAREDTQHADDVVMLLRRKFPRGSELEPYFSFCTGHPAPLTDIPSRDSRMEDAIFAFASHVFLQTADAPACQASLERLLGAVRLQYLIFFMTFVRAAHYWTKTHPELVFEGDIRHLLETHEALASCILNDPEGVPNQVGQSLLDELPGLRDRADKAIGLLAAIVNSSDDAIVSKTLDGVITTWNHGAERLFGYTAEEAVGKHISLIIPSDRMDEEVSILDRLSRGERIQHFDTVRIRKDGTAVPISVTISPVRDGAGRIIGASKVGRDITDRKLAERALRESEERYSMLADGLKFQVRARTYELEKRNMELLQQSDQLRELSKRLFQSQDDERRRIARDLHDSAGQIITVLNLNLAAITQRVGANAEVGRTLGESQELIHQLSKEIRTMSYLIHPPMLDESGLSGAIAWYIQGLAERSGLKIEVIIPDDFGRLPAEIEVAIFRIVQECLTNIHRHSGSKTATIRFSRSVDSVSMQIEDDGIGIPGEKLAAIRAQRSGVGITGMHERVRNLRGAIDIQSSHTGTIVSVTFPCSKTTSSGPDVLRQRTQSAD